MILIRTPLRLELLGGSTDIASFYKKSTGRVLNMAIGHSIHILLKEKPGTELKLSYDAIEYAPHAGKVRHGRTRAALKRFDLPKGLEIISLSDVSGAGSGLGSSSSFTVALVHAFKALKGKKASARELAEIAAAIEINDLKEPIGKQDQYAAAFGGVNALTFRKNGYVDVKQIKLGPALHKKFHDYLMVFDTGAGHSASNILREQKKSDKDNFKLLVQMADVVPAAVRALEHGDFKALGEAMQKEWSIKVNLSKGVTSAKIEAMAARGRKAGAWGGRLSGAGGGGFLVFFAPPKLHEKVEKAMRPYRYVPMKVSERGSEMIFQL